MTLGSQQYYQSAEFTGIEIQAQLVDWDTLVIGKPVAQINSLKVSEPKTNSSKGLLDWLEQQNVSLISCRLGIDSLVESMWLEDLGFRFVEMILHPSLEMHNTINTSDNEIAALPVRDEELDSIAEIARNAFQNERFHVDHRIDSEVANQRYANWVINAHNDPSQKLIKLVKQGVTIGFFIYAEQAQKIDWLLTAIAPHMQGKGLGFKAWQRMLAFHQQAGFNHVITSITVKNVAVMNLYRKLGFSFSEPEMTFHWLRS